MSSTIAGAIAVKRIIAVMRPMLRRILKKNLWKNSFWVKNRGEFPSCFFVAENRLYEGRLKENRKKFVTAFYKIGIFNKE